MATVLDKIAELKDLTEARAYSKSKNVKLAKCKTLQDVQDRLRYDWMKQTGQMKDLKAAENLMCEIHDQDVQRRTKLGALYTDVETFLDKVMQDKRLRTQLETEEVATSVNYKSTVMKFQESLRHEHCPIVLAGETSSGKSSLLNLFMEDAVLPAKILSCTSTACEIMYGEPAGQIVTKGDDGVEHAKPFPFDERDKYIYKDTDRHDVFKHTVRLWAPLPFLKSGVTLVDTPGIGENNEMKQLLLDYIAENEIYGFIYVIKSDNAGGLAKDRLQDLLLHLLKLKNEYEQKKVDPRTAIFICNRWDMVPLEERVAVEQFIVGKLQMCWPEFDPKRQLFKMSTEFAFNTLKAGYITDDYALLINGLQQLLPMGLQRKLQMAYWWLDNVLTRLHHPIQVILGRINQTDGQLQKKKAYVDKKVLAIQAECDEFVSHFNTQLESKVEMISGELLDHLKNPASADALKDWGPDDLPVEEYGDSWPIIQEKIDELIDIRIGSIMAMWERQSGLMRRNQTEMLDSIGQKTKSISEQLEDLEKVIRSTSLTDIDADSRKLVKRLSDLIEKVGSLDMPEELENAEFFKNMKVVINANVSVVSLNQNMRWLNVLDMFAAPALWEDFKKKQRRKLAENMYITYRENRVQFIADKAVLILKNIQNLEDIRQLVRGQLGGLVDYVTAVQHKTPTVLKANQELLQAIMDDTRTLAHVMQVYQPLEAEIGRLRNRSASFAYEAIREYNMPREAVVKGKPGSVTKAHRQSCRIVLDGLFAAYEIGQLPDIREAVTLKSYHQRMCDADKLQEETNIRSLMKLKLHCIPRLRDVMQTRDGMPALIFYSELVPARRRYMANTSRETVNRKHHFKNCNTLVESLCRALSYLHIKRLVHMEVSLDSVMVDVDGCVKLSNLGEARKLRLAKSVIEGPAGSYVYVPPDVLNGDRYTSASDVYSMGILIWELWHDQQVFVKQRQHSIEKFMILPMPWEVMMDPLSITHCLKTSFTIGNVVKMCMKPRVGERLGMRELEDAWGKAMTDLLV